MNPSPSFMNWITIAGFALVIIQIVVLVIIREGRNTTLQSVADLRREISDSIHEISERVVKVEKNDEGHSERMAKIEQLVVDNAEYAHREIHALRNTMTGVLVDHGRFDAEMKSFDRRLEKIE